MVLRFLLGVCFFFFFYSTKAENLIAVGNKITKKPHPQTSKETTFPLVTMAAKISRIEDIIKEFPKSY